MFDLKKRVGFILTFLFLFLLPFTVFAEEKDIIILHTNDIHCGVSDNLGIDKVAQYKKELQKKGHPVVLVDAPVTPFRELLSANFQTANPSYRL